MTSRQPTPLVRIRAEHKPPIVANSDPANFLGREERHIDLVSRTEPEAPQALKIEPCKIVDDGASTDATELALAHFRLPFFLLTGFGSGAYDFFPLSSCGSFSIRLRRLIAFVAWYG